MYDMMSHRHRATRPTSRHAARRRRRSRTWTRSPLLARSAANSAPRLPLCRNATPASLLHASLSRPRSDACAPWARTQPRLTERSPNRIPRCSGRPPQSTSVTLARRHSRRLSPREGQCVRGYISIMSMSEAASTWPSMERLWLRREYDSLGGVATQMSHGWASVVASGESASARPRRLHRG